MGEHISWALVAISGVLIAFSLIMLAVTSMTDPGFIPRSPPDPDVEYGCARNGGGGGQSRAGSVAAAWLC